MVLPMNQYPVEVIQRIVDATSQADRLSWRAADKAYCGLITPKAFKDIRIENSVMGVEKLNALIRSANLRIYINSLTYGKVDGAHEVEGPSNVDGVRYDGHVNREWYKFHNSFEDAISQLSSLPNLKTIDLTFLPFWKSKTDEMIQTGFERFIDFQALIINQLAFTSPDIPGLTTLRLGNLCPVNHLGFQRNLVEFTNTGIRSLSITIMSNKLTTGIRVYTCRYLIPVISMPYSGLTKLHLGGARGHCSVSDSMTLKERHCPHLQVLSLENIVFDFPSSPHSLYSFIIRHKSTLKNLRIHSCLLTTSVNCYAKLKYWSDIWNGFATELSALVDVDVVSPSSSESYHSIFEDGRVEPLFFAPSRVVEDDACLEKFKSVVYSRL